MQKCGFEYQTTPQQVLKGKKCRKCSGTAKKTNEEFLQELNQKNKNIKALEEYKGANTKIKFECQKCGWVWETKPTYILNEGTGCPNCYNIRRKKKK